MRRLEQYFVNKAIDEEKLLKFGFMICFAAFDQTDITCDTCGIKKAGAYLTQLPVYGLSF